MRLTPDLSGEQLPKTAVSANFSLNRDGEHRTFLNTMKNITTKKPVFDLSRSSHFLDEIGQEFPLDLIETDPRTALITLAFMFSNSTAMRCENFGLATTQLALYAAEPFAGIEEKHYQHLRATVVNYRHYCLELDKENTPSPKTAHVNRSLDQADGFADNEVSLDMAPENNSKAGTEVLSNYQRMSRMLTFILTSSEAVYELEQVKRSVLKQLHIKSNRRCNTRRGSVFYIELPETTEAIRAEVVSLLERSGWTPIRISDELLQLSRHRSPGGETERHAASVAGATASTATTGENPDGQK